MAKNRGLVNEAFDFQEEVIQFLPLDEKSGTVIINMKNKPKHREDMEKCTNNKIRSIKDDDHVFKKQVVNDEDAHLRVPKDVVNKYTSDDLTEEVLAACGFTYDKHNVQKQSNDVRNNCDTIDENLCKGLNCNFESVNGEFESTHFTKELDSFKSVLKEKQFNDRFCFTKINEELVSVDSLHNNHNIVPECAVDTTKQAPGSHNFAANVNSSHNILVTAIGETSRAHFKSNPKASGTIMSNDCSDNGNLAFAEINSVGSEILINDKANDVSRNFNGTADEKSLISDDVSFKKHSDDSANCNSSFDEIKYRFKGPIFRSFCENRKKKNWKRRSLGGELKLVLKVKESSPELNRSQYSLVSCGELTAGAVQLWLGLPEEVKYDPALAPFRKFYEKEHGNESATTVKGRNTTRSRLPFVNSAPQITNNVCVALDDNVNNILVGDVKEIDGAANADVITKKGKASQIVHYVKMTALVATWMFFTIVFLLYNENEDMYKISYVSPGEIKNYVLNSADPKLSILITMKGPFLSETAEDKLNSTELAKLPKMIVWLAPWETTKLSTQPSTVWTLPLLKNDLDYNIGEIRVGKLKSEMTNTSNTESYAVHIRTDGTTKTVPFMLMFRIGPLDESKGILYATLLLCGLYTLIISEIINRTMAAVLLSTTSLAVLSLVGQRPSIPELISWLDVETLLLLFSMMILVAIMAETGMFDFLAVYTFKITKGRLWPLITVLCAITAVLSTFLDNVTTVLLTTPVTIRLCEVMELDPIPILMAMVIFSNIGGTATPVGDPPNVIIASNAAVVQSGINFANFTMHMTLGILLVAVQCYFQLRLMFRDTNKLRANEPRDITDLRHQITIWKRSAQSMLNISRDEQIVHERLEKKVQKLERELKEKLKDSSRTEVPMDNFESTLADMNQKYKIRDMPLLIKATVAISFVIILFFLHVIPELNRVSLGWTALLGALLLLILADRENLEPILHRVEWSTLLFFASLFVMMEALSKLGLIAFIGNITENLIMKVDENARLAVALMLMLWVSGISSAFVDNIPLTTMMVRVVTSLGSNPNLNLPMAPLIWALSFGACLGGNGTLIGASANVVCAGVAEQHGYKITFMQFLKIGFPLMVGHLIVASVYLLVCHVVLQWH